MCVIILAFFILSTVFFKILSGMLTENRLWIIIILTKAHKRQKGDKIMKNCFNCNNQVDDNATFCPNCGANLAAGTAPQTAQPDPYDHTAEFDPQDISENKVYCMLAYLMGVIGIIIALLAGKDSPYVKFHIRQAIKLSVADILLLLCGGILCWTFIAPIAAGIGIAIVFVLQIIAFIQICCGKAVEPAIIRNLKFLK